ncbi:membrane protein, putative [Minicystis rosea]|nr:membrane protein, putative [Minicystis rosea]
MPRPSLTLSLLASTTLSCALLAARVQRTGSIVFCFLAYNLALAWIPLGLSTLTRRLARQGSRWSLPSAVAWWLFFPNAFYLVTDLVHFRIRPDVPHWYDVALLAAFAWSGTLLALASLATMHAIVRARGGVLLGWAFATFTCLSAGFGIWLGRVQRWNSWDAALHPLRVADDAFAVLAHPLQSAHAWGVTLSFGGLLAVIYVTVSSLRAEGPARA